MLRKGLDDERLRCIEIHRSSVAETSRCHTDCANMGDSHANCVAPAIVHSVGLYRVASWTTASASLRFRALTCPLTLAIMGGNHLGTSASTIREHHRGVVASALAPHWELLPQIWCFVARHLLSRVAFGQDPPHSSDQCMLFWPGTGAHEMSHWKGRGDPTMSLQPMDRDVTSAHVLVVDDDPDIRTLLRGILEDAGYTVGVARDGQMALDLLQQTSERWVVLTDHLMPRLGGPGLVAAVFADPQLRTRHAVIYMSAGDRDIDLDTQHLLAVLDAPVLPKPFSSAVCVALVAAAAERLANGTA